MYRGLNINGITYDVIIDVKRKTKMSYSDVTGILENRRYFVDPVGVYAEYDISIAVPKGKEDEYAELYNVLTDISNGGENSFYLPYNQEIIEVRGRVDGIQDQYVKAENSIMYWRKTKFTIKSNYPLDEVVV